MHFNSIIKLVVAMKKFRILYQQIFNSVLEILLLATEFVFCVKKIHVHQLCLGNSVKILKTLVM